MKGRGHTALILMMMEIAPALFVLLNQCVAGEDSVKIFQRGGMIREYIMSKNEQCEGCTQYILFPNAICISNNTDVSCPCTDCIIKMICREDYCEAWKIWIDYMNGRSTNDQKVVD